MGREDTHPLISSESPSYERASQLHKNPREMPEAALTAAVSQLCEVQQNAADAYRIAAAASPSEGFATELRTRAAHHEAKKAALEALVQALGGSPPRPDECRVLLRARERVEELAGCAPAGTITDTIEHTLAELPAELAQHYEAVKQTEHLDATQRAALDKLTP